MLETKIPDNKKIKLADVSAFLAQLAEQSESVYWLSSPDFSRIEYISPAYEKIWGRTRESLFANPEIWITFLHPEDAKDHHPIHAMAERIKNLGQLARYEEDYRIIRPDGEIRWIIDRGFPIYDDFGNCTGVTGVAIDITTKVRQQQEFRKIVSQVVHDIRSPLTAMQMILPECDILPQDLHSLLNRATSRISDIANKLLYEFVPEEKRVRSSNQLSCHLISTELLEVLTEKKYEYTQK
jgi:PAS domain S-box-containing protein